MVGIDDKRLNSSSPPPLRRESSGQDILNNNNNNNNNTNNHHSDNDQQPTINPIDITPHAENLASFSRPPVPLPLQPRSLSSGSLPRRTSSSHFTPKEERVHDEKSDWQRKALAKNPQVADLKERIDPLLRAITLAKLFHPGKPEVKAGLDKNMVMQLILQHLQCKGYTETRKFLEKELRIKSPPNSQTLESPLVYYLRTSLRETERVFDLSIGDKWSNEVELEEHLYTLGLLEDEGEEEDINIWLEPEENIIVDTPSQLDTEDGEELVKAGTLNKLVEKLTSESKHDMQYVKTFLMTYQSFATPEKLLAKLMQRFFVPRTFKGGSEEGKQAVVVVQLRVCNVLKNWIEAYYSDFSSPALIQTLKAFIEQIRTQGAHNSTALASMITKSLSRKEKASAKGERVFNEKTPEPTVPRNIFSSTLTLNDIDEEEIARQLTLIEFDIYEDIRPSELLNQAWSKPKLKHRAPNVLRMIERFNQVSRWVATSILNLTKVKARSRMMAKYIKIADHLRILNNYNSLMAIAAGLNFSSVHRLKYTREELPVAAVRILGELEKLMASESSFKSYRNKLASSDPPCIPFLGVYLTDLTFMDENPDTIPHTTSNGKVNLINFSKRKLVYNVISLLQQYQQRAYNLQPVHQIAAFLTKLPQLDEPELYHLSLKREPRHAQKSQIM